jgi:hydrogenase nickel incorporation protein HypA/HybF
MHEISLCESILRILEKKSKEDGFSRVVKVKIALGEYSGASRESMEFCFPLVAKGTLAEGATLDFISAKGTELRVKSLEVG